MTYTRGIYTDMLSAQAGTSVRVPPARAVIVRVAPVSSLPKASRT